MAELNPEEEEAAKAKAAQPFVWGCLGTVVLMMGFCAYIAIRPGGGGSSKPEFKGPGDRAILDSGGSNVVVAVDESAFDAYMSAVVAKDEIGWRQQFSQGQIFLTPQNTKVLVIEIGFTKKKVRILDGQHAGEAGWVPSEFVK